MNFQEYVPLAVMTAKRLDSKLEDAGHSVFGLYSEINELQDALKANDSVNVQEELGDYLWYLALMSHVLDTNDMEIIVSRDVILEQLDEQFDREWESVPFHVAFPSFLSYISSQELDVLKKYLIYKKDIERSIVEMAICKMFFAVTFICLKLSLDVTEIMAKNIKKLQDKNKGRFKTGEYTQEEAINRNLDAEREQLEKGGE